MLVLHEPLKLEARDRDRNENCKMYKLNKSI